MKKMIMEQQIFDKIFRVFKLGKPISIPGVYRCNISVSDEENSCSRVITIKSFEFTNFGFDISSYSNIIFKNCNFYNSNFDSKFTRVTFENCRFEHCIFNNNSIFKSSKFINNIFYYCDMDIESIDCYIINNDICFSTLDILFDNKYSDNIIKNTNLRLSSIRIQNIDSLSHLDIETMTAICSNVILTNCLVVKESRLESSSFILEYTNDTDLSTDAILQIDAETSSVYLRNISTGDDELQLSDKSFIRTISSTTFNIPEKYIHEIIVIPNIGSRRGTTYYDIKDNWVECGCWNGCEDKKEFPIGKNKGGTLEKFEKRVLSVYPDKSNKHHKEYMDAIAQFKKAREEYLKNNKEEKPNNETEKEVVKE